MNLRLNSKPEGCGNCRRVLGVVDTEVNFGEVKTKACAAGVLYLSTVKLQSARRMRDASETTAQVEVNNLILDEARQAHDIISGSPVLSICGNLVAMTGTAIEVELGSKRFTAGSGDNTFALTEAAVLPAALSFAHAVIR